MAEVGIRFDPATEEFQLVVDGTAALTVGKDEWSPWVQNVEGIGVTAVREETSSEEVVDTDSQDGVDSDTESETS